MDHLKMHSLNKIDENISKIANLFPNCVTEAKDENGEITHKIDFDMLKQELSHSLVEGREERYQFTWPDKKQVILTANAPINKTLRPRREESVNFDETENLYIEGDNLEVLKLLQETYLGKIKMIYIDPPYNTGNDFVYNDEFSVSSSEFSERSGNFDEEGNRLVDNYTRNTESNGRFHTDWLNMMYPRLKLARDLLSDDGVIFISIDDNEVENLKKVCDEIFNNGNFINLVTVKTKIGGVSGSSEGKSLRGATEYLLIYAKSRDNLIFNPVYIKTKLSTKIKNYEENGKSWKYTSVLTKLEGKTLIKEDTAKKMKFYGYKVVETKSISAFAKENKMTEEQVYDQYADKIFQTTNAQTSIRQTVLDVTEKEEYEMIGLEYTPIKGKNADSVIEILYKGEQRRMMMFLSDAVTRIDGEYFYLDKITTLWDDILYNNLAKEGDVDYSNGKKPIFMINRLIEMIANKDDIILDFFAGSASSAHATVEMNKQKNLGLKFIMVQLPEDLDESYKNADSNGKKDIKVLLDYLDKMQKPHLLTEIGKQRLRNVGKQILEQVQNDKEKSHGLDFANAKSDENLLFNETPLGVSNPCDNIGSVAGVSPAEGVAENAQAVGARGRLPPSGNYKLDIGFRVLKCDTSNMEDVYYSPDHLDKQDLFKNNIKSDRTAEDLLFQVMLDLGIMLSSKIQTKQIDGKTVYCVEGNYLMACFDDTVDEATITEIAKEKPYYFVMRDPANSKDGDSLITNFEQIFTIYSPETIRKVL